MMLLRISSTVWLSVLAVGFLQTDAGAQSTVVVEHQPATGVYVFRYPAGGEQRSFVLTPGTLTKPSIDVQVEKIGTERFRYTYAFANAEGARQDIHSVSVRALTGSTIVETPTEWQPNAVPTTARISWYRKPTSAGLEGVKPGTELAGFVIESEYLPGPSQARVYGNVAPPRIPPDAPADFRTQLERILTQQDHLVVNTLSPVIPAGLNEPELQDEVLASRIYGAYAKALAQSVHPRRQDLDTTFQQAIQLMSNADAKGRPLVVAISEMARNAGEDPWARALSRGLTLSLEVFLSSPWQKCPFQTMTGSSS